MHAHLYVIIPQANQNHLPRARILQGGGGDSAPLRIQSIYINERIELYRLQLYSYFFAQQKRLQVIIFFGPLSFFSSHRI